MRVDVGAVGDDTDAADADRVDGEGDVGCDVNRALLLLLNCTIVSDVPATY